MGIFGMCKEFAHARLCRADAVYLFPRAPYLLPLPSADSTVANALAPLLRCLSRPGGSRRDGHGVSRTDVVVGRACSCQVALPCLASWA